MKKPKADAVPPLEETKRVARVLRIVQLITAQPQRWSRARLAQEFELSERMIDNDLQLIRHALRYEMRRGQGGYYFTESPLVKPVQLTLPETLALALSAQQARQTGAVDPATVSGALARLEGALPPRIVPYLRAADATAGHPIAGPTRNRTLTLATLERAQVEGRKVRMTYATASRGDAVSERTVAPYALQFYDRSWMLIGQDSMRDAILIFKVDRILECELTEERYTVPERFNLQDYLGTTWGILRGEAGPPEDVVLRFTAHAAPWVRDERWHPSQELVPQPNGTLVVRFHCSVNHELVRWLLSFGGQVSIERPGHLREAVIEEARQILMRDDHSTREGDHGPQ